MSFNQGHQGHQGHRIPRGHERFAPGGIVDLSHIPVMKVWVCDQGHKYEAAEPVTVLVLQMSDGRQLRSTGICPMCYASWLGITFQVWEDGTPKPELPLVEEDGSPETAAVEEAQNIASASASPSSGIPQDTAPSEGA